MERITLKVPQNTERTPEQREDLRRKIQNYAARIEELFGRNHVLQIKDSRAE